MSEPIFKTLYTNSQEVDVSKQFGNFKYAVPEHEPIQLTNGMWLHTYRLTRYDDTSAGGDSDVEYDSWKENL